MGGGFGGLGFRVVRVDYKGLGFRGFRSFGFERGLEGRRGFRGFRVLRALQWPMEHSLQLRANAPCGPQA